MSNTETKPAGKPPSHVAYQVHERQGKKAIWRNIGVAWPHADGKGFNIELAALPVDGRISLRIATDKKD